MYKYDDYSREELLDQIDDLDNEVSNLEWEVENLKQSKIDYETINEYCMDCNNKYNTIKCLECKLNQFKLF